MDHENFLCWLYVFVFKVVCSLFVSSTAKQVKDCKPRLTLHVSHVEDP